MDIGEIIENLEAQNARREQEIQVETEGRQMRVADLKSQIKITNRWISDLRKRIRSADSRDVGKDLARYG